MVLTPRDELDNPAQKVADKFAEGKLLLKEKEQFSPRTEERTVARGTPCYLAEM